MKAPISALSAARVLCERSGWTLTNLELQKMLYLAQMVYMGEHEGEPLFNGAFEAWDFGPVQPDVYRLVRAYGAGPIFDVFPSGGSIDEARRETLEAAYDQLSKFKPGQLVNITHDPIGAWAKHYRPDVSHILIPNADIYAEARRRHERARTRVAGG